MRAAINRALDQLDAVFTPETLTLNPSSLKPLVDAIAEVQDAYLEVIQQALRLLMQNNPAASHRFLQNQRDDLTTTLDRIALLIEQVAEANQPMLKLVVEYLYTRARLIDELKMYPNFTIELLEHLTLDDSMDATIGYMESVMTGQSNLYEQILRTYQQLP